MELGLRSLVQDGGVTTAVEGIRATPTVRIEGEKLKHGRSILSGAGAGKILLQVLTHCLDIGVRITNWDGAISFGCSVGSHITDSSTNVSTDTGLGA